MPAVGVRRVFLSISGKRLRGVLFRIDRDGNEFHVRVRLIHILEGFQILRHDRADAAAGGKKERRDPDLVVQTRGIKGLILRVNKPELPHPSVDRKRWLRGVSEKDTPDPDKDGQRDRRKKSHQKCFCFHVLSCTVSLRN